MDFRSLGFCQKEVEPRRFRWHTSYWDDYGQEERMLSRRQKGGDGDMIWACFSENGFSEIAFLNGRSNSNKFVSTLENLYTRTTIFRQYNALIFTSTTTKKWMNDRKMNLMPWPTKSPDLNAIMRFSAIVSRRVYADRRPSGTVTGLKECIMRECGKLDQSL